MCAGWRAGRGRHGPRIGASRVPTERADLAGSSAVPAIIVPVKPVQASKAGLEQGSTPRKDDVAVETIPPKVMVRFPASNQAPSSQPALLKTIRIAPSVPTTWSRYSSPVDTFLIYTSIDHHRHLQFPDLQTLQLSPNQSLTAQTPSKMHRTYSMRQSRAPTASQLQVRLSRAPLTGRFAVLLAHAS